MERQKTAITVAGPMPAQALGRTYVHEHLLVKPQLPGEQWAAYTLDSVEKSLQETRLFQQAGGGTLVEMTPLNYGRDPAGCLEIARKTGVNVIATTGYHKQEFLPAWFDTESDEQLYARIRRDVEQGMDDTTARPGVVKFGTSLNAVTPAERRALCLAARAHREFGLPLSTHCDKGTMGLEQLTLLQENGVSPQEVLLCHTDIAQDMDYTLRLLDRGANLCIDHVGRDLAGHDAFRVKLLQTAIGAGYIGQLMLAGDMGKKDYLPSYLACGQPGFAYILTRLRQDLLEHISPEQFEQMLVENPRRFFAVFDQSAQSGESVQ